MYTVRLIYVDSNILLNQCFEQVGKHLLGLTKTYVSATSRVCQMCHHSHIRHFSRSVPAAGVFEPDDVKLEPDIPEYPSLNLRMRGYDFVSLESYAKHVHRMANDLELDASAWAVPARCFDIKTFKPNSSVVDNNYSLRLFERTVQIDNVPSTTLPILLEMMRVHAPEGIYVTVKEPEAEEEELRYIPDKEMQDLRTQMKAIDDAREERRKK